MRTTLTVEESIDRRLRELAHRQHRTYKAIVNETLRAGLAAQERPRRGGGCFRVRAKHCGFQPGVDLRRLNQLVDDLEADELVGKARGVRR